MNTKELTIIGAGSLGSSFLSAGLICGKMSETLGFRRIYIYDFDKVEPRNLLNQMYRPKDVGESKISAIENIIQQFSESKIIPKNEKVGPKSNLSGVIVTLVDNMDARRQIFELCRYRADIPYYVDARTGLNEAYVVAFDPRDPDCVERYERTLYPQSEAVQAPCADSRSIPTLWSVAGVIQECLRLFKKKPQNAALADKATAFIAATIGKVLVRFKTQKVRDTEEFLETIIIFNDLPYLKTQKLYLHTQSLKKT